MERCGIPDREKSCAPVRAVEGEILPVPCFQRPFDATACVTNVLRDFAGAVALTWSELPRVFRMSLLLLAGAMAVGQVLQHTRAPAALVANANANVGTRLSPAGLPARPSIVDLARAVDDQILADVGRDIGLRGVRGGNR